MRKILNDRMFTIGTISIGVTSAIIMALNFNKDPFLAALIGGFFGWGCGLVCLIMLLAKLMATQFVADVCTKADDWYEQDELLNAAYFGVVSGIAWFVLWVLFIDAGCEGFENVALSGRTLTVLGITALINGVINFVVISLAAICRGIPVSWIPGYELQGGDNPSMR